jgi:aminopeptidase N
VRALIGGFSANQTQFNRPDGAGYDLLAEIVLTLDPTNPQVAARLLSGLRSWRSLEPVRQAKAQEALGAIAAKTELSADVRDIVTRSLN